MIGMGLFLAFTFGLVLFSPPPGDRIPVAIMYAGLMTCVTLAGVGMDISMAIKKAGERRNGSRQVAEDTASPVVSGKK